MFPYSLSGLVWMVLVLELVFLLIYIRSDLDGSATGTGVSS
jgi:hypothetical protein